MLPKESPPDVVSLAEKRKMFYVGAMFLFSVLTVFTDPINGPLYTFMFLYTLFVLEMT